MKKLLLLVLSIMTAAVVDAKEQLVMELQDGDVVIEFFENKAPKHVERIKQLTKKGFYDGLVFHRVIDGFMAQTGDPSGSGMGGSDLGYLKAEFNDVRHERGVVSMARAANVDSANSQFFIMFKPAPHLDGQYTAWGRVVSGMEHVDAIKKGDVRQGGRVQNPDKIIKMYIREVK